MKWNKIEDGAPKPYKDVLVQDNRGDTYIAWINGDEDWETDNMNTRPLGIDVSYWLDIPENDNKEVLDAKTLVRELEKHLMRSIPDIVKNVVEKECEKHYGRSLLYDRKPSLTLTND